MSRMTRQIEVAADPRTVWSVVGDLESVSVWNPNVKSATCGASAQGLGATRRCELAPRGHIDEVVSEWIDGREVWFALGSHGAIRSADMGTVLTPSANGTIVEAIAEYHLAFGPLGPVIDKLTMKRMMANMLDSGLAGLKQHVEQQGSEDQEI